MNGGSYRLFARHFKKGSIKFKEKTYGIRELKAFFKRVEKAKIDMQYLFNGEHLPYKIYGYGASTKANTILQYYGTKPKAIVDINQNKLGKYTVNTGIPVINTIPKDCEYLWVFPYGFTDFFKKKEKNYKGKWVTTIPKFEIT